MKMKFKAALILFFIFLQCIVLKAQEDLARMREDLPELILKNKFSKITRTLYERKNKKKFRKSDEFVYCYEPADSAARRIGYAPEGISFKGEAIFYVLDPTGKARQMMPEYPTSRYFAPDDFVKDNKGRYLRTDTDSIIYDDQGRVIKTIPHNNPYWFREYIYSGDTVMQETRHYNHSARRIFTYHYEKGELKWYTIKELDFHPNRPDEKMVFTVKENILREDRFINDKLDTYIIYKFEK
jgi:hypothetical protein